MDGMETKKVRTSHYPAVTNNYQLQHSTWSRTCVTSVSFDTSTTRITEFRATSVRMLQDGGWLLQLGSVHPWVISNLTALTNLWYNLL